MTKKSHQKFWRRKATFFRKSWIFSRKSWIFSQNASQLHRNLTWGFLGFFSGLSRGFHFLEWQCCSQRPWLPVGNPFCFLMSFVSKNVSCCSQCLSQAAHKKLESNAPQPHSEKEKERF